jgi:YD repeat-containing protein
MVMAMAASACGDNHTSAPAAVDAAAEPPAPQPRLVSVGSAGTVSYDDEGYPVGIGALYSTYDLAWNGGQLAHATASFKGFSLDHTLEVVPAYEDGRLVQLTIACTGACKGPSRVDTFGYDERGSLRTWDVAGFGASRTYAYDDRGRLVEIAEAAVHDTIEYSEGPCPTAVMERGYRSEVPYDSLGRLQDMYPIVYNDQGLIQRFGGTGTAFQDLVYEPGVARGIDLWPGLYDGGFVYGFPVRGELFRLDGGCDVTMGSQPTIAALALTRALFESIPPSGFTP